MNCTAQSAYNFQYAPFHSPVKTEFSLQTSWCTKEKWHIHSLSLIIPPLLPPTSDLSIHPPSMMPKLFVFRLPMNVACGSTQELSV